MAKVCLIIDANVAHRVLLRNDDEDFKYVHSYLFSIRYPNGKLMFGGRLAEEYFRIAAVRRIVLELNRAGRAIRVQDDLVNNEEAVVCGLGYCRSNDEHIIALARVTGVRLLCSLDQDLHADFTNGHLVSKPRGRVYQYATHRRLLAWSCD
jgi:hypothetical protein